MMQKSKGGMIWLLKIESKIIFYSPMGPRSVPSVMSYFHLVENFFDLLYFLAILPACCVNLFSFDLALHKPYNGGKDVQIGQENWKLMRDKVNWFFPMCLTFHTYLPRSLLSRFFLLFDEIYFVSDCFVQLPVIRIRSN